MMGLDAFTSGTATEVVELSARDAHSDSDTNDNRSNNPCIISMEVEAKEDGEPVAWNGLSESEEMPFNDTTVRSTQLGSIAGALDLDDQLYKAVQLYKADNSAVAPENNIEELLLLGANPSKRDPFTRLSAFEECCRSTNLYPFIAPILHMYRSHPEWRLNEPNEHHNNKNPVNFAIDSGCEFTLARVLECPIFRIDPPLVGWSIRKIGHSSTRASVNSHPESMAKLTGFLLLWCSFGCFLGKDATRVETDVTDYILLAAGFIRKLTLTPLQELYLKLTDDNYEQTIELTDVLLRRHANVNALVVSRCGGRPDILLQVARNDRLSLDNKHHAIMNIVDRADETLLGDDFLEQFNELFPDCRLECTIRPVRVYDLDKLQEFSSTMDETEFIVEFSSYVVCHPEETMSTKWNDWMHKCLDITIYWDILGVGECLLRNMDAIRDEFIFEAARRVRCCNSMILVAARIPMDWNKSLANSDFERIRFGNENCITTFLDNTYNNQLMLSQLPDVQKVLLNDCLRPQSILSDRQLLQYGSYLGGIYAPNRYHISHMDPKMVRERLDQCITQGGRIIEYLAIDYSNLRPYADHDETLEFLVTSEHCRDLLVHPVVTSFMDLKWMQIRNAFYLNFAMVVLGAMPMMAYVYLYYLPDSESPSLWLRIFAMVGTVLLAGREILQMFLLSLRVYVRKPRNYVEWLRIVANGFILLGDAGPICEDYVKRQISVIAMLLTVGEIGDLVRSLPLLSLNLNIIMLLKVFQTFVSKLSLYTSALFVLALGFYTLLAQKPDGSSEAATDTSTDTPPYDLNSFANLPMSVVKMLVMMTGEFEASEIDLSSKFTVGLLVFSILLLMAMFNLLVGLAVSDIQMILSQAEIEYYAHRAKILMSFERVWQNRSDRIKRCEPILARFGIGNITLFPDYMGPYNCQVVFQPDRTIIWPKPARMQRGGWMNPGGWLSSHRMDADIYRRALAIARIEDRPGPELAYIMLKSVRVEYQPL